MFDYIYVSQRRLLDLAGQLPPGSRTKFESTIKAAIPGVIEAGLKGETSSDGPRIFDMLSRVETALRRDGSVGLFGDSKPWFTGTLSMYWGASTATQELPAQSDESLISPVVFFGGRVGSQVILLGGSQKHLRGSAELKLASTSDLPQILGALAAHESGAEIMDVEPAQGDEEAYVYAAIDYSQGNWGGVQQRLTFLAKRLATWNDIEFQGERWRVTVGAPLYVRS